jgi:hypothetical protein
MQGYTFKLIKEFPGSDEVGTIYTYDRGSYRNGKRLNTVWKHDYFMKWVGVYFELKKV